MPRSPHKRLLSRNRCLPRLEVLEDRRLLSASLLNHTFQPSGLTIQPSANLGVAVYTPQQIRTAYGLTSLANEGEGMTVAIVDAYSQPYIASDVSEFSSLFGLPQLDGVGGDGTFTVSTPTGQATPGLPPSGSNWGIEISLDVEYVHTIVPKANIDLVETQNNSGDSLFAAEVDGQPYESGVFYAKNLPGVVVVSNSYGGDEFNGETNYDSEFTTPNNNVAFAFSTGDDGAPGSYPAYSPNVVAVGGTTLNTLSAKGVYGTETGWSGSGGGVSQYEPTVPFQTNNGVNFGARSTPDISMEANPNTGVFVLDSLDYPDQLIEVGGTSLAAPMFAGVITLGDQSRLAGGGQALSSVGVNNILYAAYNSANYKTDFHDITSGDNGFIAGPGYDLVTGIGSPKAQLVVPLLASSSVPSVVVGGSLGVGGSTGVHASLLMSHSAELSGGFSAVAGLSPLSATSTAGRAAGSSVATPANFSQTAAQVSLPAGHGLLSQTAQISGGGEASVTDAAEPIDTMTNVPSGADLFSAPTATQGIALTAGPATQAVTSALPISGVFGTADAVFANFGPLEAEADSVTLLLPSVAAREESTSDLSGLAGLAVFLGGAWTYLTPKKADTLQASLSDDSRKAKTK
jgi:hypothetical protein